MARLISWLITLAVIALGVLWPWLFQGGATDTAAPYDPVVFNDYDVDIVVTDDGTMTAVETITADFPSGRHGLFRYWDVANPNDPNIRQRPEVTSVLLDGRPARYEMLWEDGRRFRVAKIGDPDRTLSYGAHVFEIRYTIPGVLDPGTTGAGKQFAATTGDPTAAPTVFFWNVIAPSWNNHIRAVDVSVELPASVTGAQCSVGSGVGVICDDLTIRGNRVELSGANLAPRTPVTVRAGVDLPTPARPTLPWSYTWDRVLGQSVAGVVGVAALTLLLAAGALLWLRAVTERNPGFPLQYAPPPGLGPVQVEYLRTEWVPKNGLTATLFYLAERGLITLQQVSDKHWRIRGVAQRGQWRDVDPVSAAVGRKLKVDSAGAEFEAKKTVKSGERLQKAKAEMTETVEKWALTSGLMVQRKKELWLRAANGVAFVLMICAFFNWGPPFTLWALPFAAFFVFSAASWRPGVGTRRTAAGRELWSRIGGFHRVLATDSAESRFDFAARKDLYTTYVPFAVAAGAAAMWAKKYQEVTGNVAPQPDWYSSSTTTSSGWFGSGGGADPS